MKTFKMQHTLSHTVKEFREGDAPSWLTSEKTVIGSTMDNRWFWELVKQLPVGGSIDTDFQTITRIQ